MGLDAGPRIVGMEGRKSPPFQKEFAAAGAWSGGFSPREATDGLP